MDTVTSVPRKKMKPIAFSAPLRDPCESTAAFPDSFSELARPLLELDSTHPAQQAWRLHHNEFLECVRDAGHRMHSVYAGVYSYGPGTKDIALVVWLGLGDLLTRFHRRLQTPACDFIHHRLPYSTYLRFFKRTVHPFLESKEDDTPERVRFPHGNKVYIGSSVGPAESGGTGTIACFVQLREEKTGTLLPGQFALTAHHVLRDDALPFNDDEGEILVESPSKPDTCLTLRSYANDIAETSKLIEACKQRARDEPTKKLRATLKDPSLDPREGARLSDVLHERETLLLRKERLRSLYQMRDTVANFDASLGFVFKTSGSRNTYHGIQDDEYNMDPYKIDWGLIKLGFGRVGVNAISPEEALTNLTIVPHEWDFCLRRIRCPADVIRGGTKVFKFGRSSDLTCGILAKRRDISLSPGPYNQICAEWTITSANEDGSHKAFSYYGDSGAGVIDEHGHFLGLVWGGSPGHVCGDQTNMTPWEVIKKDVLQQTGYIMEWSIESSTTLYLESSFRSSTSAAPSTRSHRLERRRKKESSRQRRENARNISRRP